MDERESSAAVIVIYLTFVNPASESALDVFVIHETYLGPFVLEFQAISRRIIVDKTQAIPNFLWCICFSARAPSFWLKLHEPSEIARKLEED